MRATARQLSEAQREGPLSAERVARLGAVLAGQLAEAHARGEVHGALSAEQVELWPAVRLLGFGGCAGTREGDVRDLARVLAEALGADPATGALPRFTPPELAVPLGSARAGEVPLTAALLAFALETAAEALGADPLGASGSTAALLRQVAAPPLAPVLPRSERFELRALLGAGAFGTVYEAWDRARRELVALKVLGHVDGDGLYRFKKEFRALSTIHHPGVVRLHELFAVDGAWFFTMELVRGLDFVTFVRAHPELLHGCFAQLVDAVAAIHAAGRLHRDLKPKNVFVTAEGAVKVLDFGLVAELEPGDRQTAEWAGTPAYMAPETIANAPQSAATDWYAVGAMLFEALTGQLPFAPEPGKNVLAEKLEREPVLARALAPACSPELAALAAALLRREPSARPGHAALAAALGAPAPVETSARAPFCGRAQELGALRAALAAARSGPQAVLVEGRAGIGKTALLERFLAEAARGGGACVLRARCDARESVPYRGLDGAMDALSRWLRGLPEVEVAGLRPRRVDAACLAELFPVLGRVRAWGVEPRAVEGLGPAERRARALVGLRELFARVAERGPLVLAIDDAQWLGDDARALLEAVLAPGEGPPVLVVLAAPDAAAARGLPVRRVTLGGGAAPVDVGAMIAAFRFLSAAAADGLAMPTRGVVPALFRAA